MKVEYRGFDIDCTREKCLAGYPLLYYSVFRKSDGYEVTSGYTEGSDTVRDYVKYMKEHVDDFIQNPGDWCHAEPGTDDHFTEMADHRTENEKTENAHETLRS